MADTTVPDPIPDSLPVPAAAAAAAAAAAVRHDVPVASASVTATSAPSAVSPSGSCSPAPAQSPVRSVPAKVAAKLEKLVLFAAKPADGTLDGAMQLHCAQAMAELVATMNVCAQERLCPAEATRLMAAHVMQNALVPGVTDPAEYAAQLAALAVRLSAPGVTGDWPRDFDGKNASLKASAKKVLSMAFSMWIVAGKQPTDVTKGALLDGWLAIYGHGHAVTADMIGSLLHYVLRDISLDTFRTMAHAAFVAMGNIVHAKLVDAIAARFKEPMTYLVMQQHLASIMRDAPSFVVEPNDYDAFAAKVSERIAGELRKRSPMFPDCQTEIATQPAIGSNLRSLREAALFLIGIAGMHNASPQAIANVMLACARPHLTQQDVAAECTRAAGRPSSRPRALCSTPLSASSDAAGTGTSACQSPVSFELRNAAQPRAGSKRAADDAFGYDAENERALLKRPRMA